jgi:hypothetical protein
VKLTLEPESESESDSDRLALRLMLATLEFFWADAATVIPITSMDNTVAALRCFFQVLILVASPLAFCVQPVESATQNLGGRFQPPLNHCFSRPGTKSTAALVTPTAAQSLPKPGGGNSKGSSVANIYVVDLAGHEPK